MNLLEIFQQIPTIAYIVFIIGTALALAEFCIPGFGICGICAFVCYTVSIILSANSLAAGIVFALLVLIVITILVVIFSVFASRNKFIKPLVLNDSLNSEEGFSSSKNYDCLVGKIGTAKSVLRPSGKVEIDGNTYNVVTEGEFVDPGVQIRIAEVSGSRIVVEKCPESIIH